MQGPSPSNEMPNCELARKSKSAKVTSRNPMSNSARQKPFSKAVLIFIVLAVVGLGIVFALLATLGDDVPNELPPATRELFRRMTP